ncbi:MAG: hypothetical protein J2O49_06075, partial [Sciscionella sp.]|nr:hypothetical protein [Sciscionella sp.]
MSTWRARISTPADAIARGPSDATSAWRPAMSLCAWHVPRAQGRACHGVRIRRRDLARDALGQAVGGGSRQD